MALGTYNRTRANLKSGGRRFDAQYSMYGAMSVLAGASTVLSPAYQLNSALGVHADLWWGYDEAYELSAAMLAEADATLEIRPAYAYAGQLDAKANPMLVERYRLLAEASASADMKQIVYPQYGTLFGALTCAVDGTQTREVILAFDNLDIPAGASLVIDMGNMTATLDGVDVIDSYAGDFFDLNRELRGIEVSSGTSGDVAVSVLYEEKYL